MNSVISIDIVISTVSDHQTAPGGARLGGPHYNVASSVPSPHFSCSLAAAAACPPVNIIANWGNIFMIHHSDILISSKSSNGARSLRPLQAEGRKVSLHTIHRFSQSRRGPLLVEIAYKTLLRICAN